MSNDFVIENGILIDYEGAGGDVIIPDGVTSIGKNAFSWCHFLVGVTIPDSVTSIQDYAFHYCPRLTNITFSNNVTSIGSWAFSDCSSLKSIAIPGSVTNIGWRVFCGCVDLTSNNPKLRFKATDKYMQCRGFQYSLNEWFEIDGEIKLCERGFHSCKNPFDVFNHYYGKIKKDFRLWLVETDDESKENEDDSKVVSKRIRFIKELTISELADYTLKN